MLLACLAIGLGFVVLMISADKFVEGAASIAYNFGMSRMLIGLTIVALGTSAPEIIVSILSALEGSAALAAGNAIGSNLANIGMVLGATALIASMPIQSSLIKAEIPILFAATLLAGYVLHNHVISFTDSLLLISGLVLFLLFLFKKQNSDKTLAAEEDDEVCELTQLPTAKATAYFVLGLIFLLASAEALVWGAKSIALSFGISELVIGVTIVAVGTSLPELAASIASARKGHLEIAIGNVVGSNIFNLLIVLAMPGFISSQALPEAVFSRDYLSMLAMTSVWMLLLGACFIRKVNFSRPMGIVLLLGYTAYYILLAQQLSA